MIFRGSDAIRDGRFTPNQLRGPLVTRLFRDVYADAAVQVTHEVRCRAATLILPPDAVVTGRSAATVRGVALSRAADPVEVIVPFERKVSHRAGLDVRRTDIGPDEWRPWQRGRLASPLRMALDLALDRALPVAVGDLDAVLRRNLVALDDLTDLVNARSDRGIQNARRAVELVDPRAESRPDVTGPGDHFRCSQGCTRCRSTRIEERQRDALLGPTSRSRRGRSPSSSTASGVTAGNH